LLGGRITEAKGHALTRAEKISEDHPSMSGEGVAARAEELTKVYGSGDARVVALDGVDISFASGQFAAIMGPSGSGKSTLMHCMAGLDTPSSGRAFIGNSEITAMKDKALTRLRRDHVGFIFQSYNLLPTLTAGENMTLPADIAGRSLPPEWLDQIIDTVDLRSRLGHRPGELSGGQQQRVAVARALAGRPSVIFADEPTGNLDSRTATDVLELLRRCVHELGQSIVMVTHDPVAAARADRAVFLADGQVVDDLSSPTADSILEAMKDFERVGPRG
jgi:putative ABC transport system ATP-binding protein